MGFEEKEYSNLDFESMLLLASMIKIDYNDIVAKDVDIIIQASFKQKNIRVLELESILWLASYKSIDFNDIVAKYINLSNLLVASKIILASWHPEVS